MKNHILGVKCLRRELKALDFPVGEETLMPKRFC